MRVPAARPPRFGQLTHTCFHADGFGGWQVKEVAGGIDAEEQRLLEVGTARFDVGALPRFLNRRQVDALPRRLVHAPLGVPAGTDGTATAYWHAVPAGADSSGRPGNVFTHVVLDRRPDAPEPPLRPTDLLRAPQWLRPYGAEQVLAATLAGVPEPPWRDPVHDRAAVLEFLVERALWRGGALRGLLDAVHGALQRGPMVVLGVVDPADAERWVAAVCHLLAPGTSRRLYFSTAERAAGVPAARAAGLHLVVVPAADLAQVERDDRDDRAVVLLSDEDLPGGRPAVEFVDFDGEPGGEGGEVGEQVHTTRYGSRIPATPWSTTAAAVLRDGALAAQLLARQDAVAAEVGDRDLPCGWPLALAVVERALGPDAGARARKADESADVTGVLDDALPAASALLRGPLPPGVAGTPLHATVRLVRERALGRTTADAWLALQAPLPPGTDRGSAVAVYLARAVQDRKWLLQDGGPPTPELPAHDRADHDVMDRTHEALERLAAGLRRTSGTRRLDPAVEALRLLDLVTRAGLAPRLDPTSVDEVLERVAGPPLLDPATGPDLVERVGPLAEPTQARVVRPWVDGRLPLLPVRPGCRLAPAVLRWLFPEPPGPPSPADLVRPEGLPATLLEAAAQAALVLPDPSAFRPAVLVAELTDAAVLGSRSRAALGPALPVAAVAALLRVARPQLLVDVLAPTLLSAPTGPELDDVLDRVRPTDGNRVWATPAGRAVQEARELRVLERAWSRARDERDGRPAFSRFARLLRPLAAAGAPTDRPLAPELLAAGAAADVLDRVEATDEIPGPPLVAHAAAPAAECDPVAGTAIAGRVADAVGHGVVSDVRVVLAAQLGACTLDGTTLGPPSWHGLAQVRWTSDGRRERLLDHVVRLRVRRLRSSQQDELVAAAREWVAAVVSDHEERLDAQRALADYDHFALDWWRAVGVPDDALRVVHRSRWRPS